MSHARLRLALLLAALASALALGTAFASEWWGGLVPCALCLVERWPYRIAIGLGIAGALLPPRWARLAAWACVLALLSGAAAAVVHVGVENALWPSPLPQCMAPNLGSGSIAERLARMPATPSKACEDATYLVPGLKLSMAAMNLIYAAATGFALAAFLWRSRRSAPR